jgi:serine/threonine-protein kinase
MGEVYLAQHPRLPRLDALKILPEALTDDELPEALTDDEEFRARFRREAELAASLWHPHIVGVHDRGEFNGKIWISMDYVDGTDAAGLVRERYPTGMPERLVIEIVIAVADALDFAHEHRMLPSGRQTRQHPADKSLNSATTDLAHRLRYCPQHR